MPDTGTDTVSAARMVATQFEAAKRAGHTDVALRMSEVIALLPILDAVAAGQGDEGRIERWARSLCRIKGWDPDAVGRLESGGGKPEWLFYKVDACAAIAVADAEAAAKAMKR